MFRIFLISLRDLLNPKILKLSLVPILLSAILLGAVFYLFQSNISSLFIYMTSFIPFIGDSDWFRSSIETIGVVFIYYHLLIIISLMLVGLISDKVVDIVNTKHYHLQKLGFGTTQESVIISLKQNIIFVILLLLLLPTLFIPIVNIIVMVFLWSIAIKKPMSYDSISTIATKDEYQELLSTNKLKTTTLSLLTASLFLIPILGILVYILQLLAFSHFNMSRLQTIRLSKTKD